MEKLRRCQIWAHNESVARSGLNLARGRLSFSYCYILFQSPPPRPLILPEKHLWLFFEANSQQHQSETRALFPNNIFSFLSLSLFSISLERLGGRGGCTTAASAAVIFETASSCKHSVVRCREKGRKRPLRAFEDEKASKGGGGGKKMLLLKVCCCCC